MNATLTTDVKDLIARGSRPSVVLRHILHHEKHDHFSLLMELRDLFNLDVKTAIEIRGWSYWDGKGFDDVELDELLKGKLKLKPA